MFSAQDQDMSCSAGSIVTDEVVSIPPSRGHPRLEMPTYPSKQQAPGSPRCDSGFNSGPLVPHHLSSSSPSPLASPAVLDSGKVPVYHRLDSGFSTLSEFESLSLTESSPKKCVQPPPQIVKSEKSDRELTRKEFEDLYHPDKDGDCQLHLAIASGFTEVVFALIRMAPHPNYLDIQNNELWAPLHIAVLMNQPNIVRRLVVAGATTDIRDLEGNTPLHLASKRGYLECAEALLRSISVDELREASVAALPRDNLHQILDLKNYHGENAIHLATFGQHYNFIRFLSWSNADMNATEGRSGKTALHYAVNKRDLTLVALLANQRSAGGCEVYLNTQDWAGRTPVQCAAINGDADIVALLTGLPNCDTTEWESDGDYEFDTDEEIVDIDKNDYNDIEVNGGRVCQSMAA